jgi:hypothetical protein
MIARQQRGSFMRIFDLFSKRQADAAKSGQIDVYQYADIPSNLRIQVQQIALEGIGLVGAPGDRLLTGTRTMTYG